MSKEKIEHANFVSHRPMPLTKAAWDSVKPESRSELLRPPWLLGSHLGWSANLQRLLTRQGERRIRRGGVRGGWEGVYDTVCVGAAGRDGTLTRDRTTQVFFLGGLSDQLQSLKVSLSCLSQPLQVDLSRPVCIFFPFQSVFFKDNTREDDTHTRYGHRTTKKGVCKCRASGLFYRSHLLIISISDVLTKFGFSGFLGTCPHQISRCCDFFI